MADMNGANRPLSPHLQIFRWHIPMLTSILNRATGVALLAGALLVVAWFFSAAVSADCFASMDAFVKSWFGQLVLLGSLWALAYHALGGIRHMIWDQGWWLEIETAEKLGWAVIIGSFILTAIVVVAI